jgi:hypothetical protein
MMGEPLLKISIEGAATKGCAPTPSNSASRLLSCTIALLDIFVGND